MKRNSLSSKVFTVFLSLLLIISLTGCGPKPEDTVKTFFDSLQKQDVKTAKNCLSPNSSSNDFSFDNPEQEKAVKLIFSILKYEIISTTVDGDTAKVKAKVTSIDMVKVMSDAISNILPTLFASALSGQDTSNLEALMNQYLTNRLSDPNVPLTTSEIDINLVKDNNKKWVIVPDDNLLNAMTGNLQKAFASIEQSLKKIPGIS